MYFGRGVKSLRYDRVKKLTAVILCGSFVIGVFAGVFCARLIGTGLLAALSEEVFARIATGGVSPLRAVAACLWPVLAAVSAGMTVYCRAVYPMLFFGRGVSFAYGVAAVCSCFDGAKGVVISLGLVAPKNLLLGAGLMVLCMDSFAKTLGGKRKPEGEQCYVPDSAFYKRSAAAFLLAVMAAGYLVHFSPVVGGLI